MRCYGSMDIVSSMTPVSRMAVNAGSHWFARITLRIAGVGRSTGTSASHMYEQSREKEARSWNWSLRERRKAEVKKSCVEATRMSPFLGVQRLCSTWG